MNIKAQAQLEAMALIALVAIALITMRGYMLRAIQGRWKQTADAISEEQYERGVSIEHEAGSPGSTGIAIHIDGSSSLRMTSTFSRPGSQGPVDYSLTYSDISAVADELIKVGGWGVYAGEIDDY